MSPYLDDGDVTLYQGDAAQVLAGLPDASVDSVVTSPPYFGLRDYGYEGQIGLEDTPAAFVARLVDVFRQVRRVLAPHGTCWVNMGDSYAGGGGFSASAPSTATSKSGRYGVLGSLKAGGIEPRDAGVKAKDLLGIPWRLAFALQDDGWWLRSDVIWAKPNPMPESVTDRPTKAHEYLFLLTKAPRYYWDAEGVREPAEYGRSEWRGDVYQAGDATRNPARGGFTVKPGGGGSRNVRSVWTFPTEPNPEAHFATFPRELVRRCLAAGCPERVCATCGAPSVRVVEREPNGASRRADESHNAGTGLRPHSGYRGFALVHERGWTDCGHGAYRSGVVLDPFIGSGTTAVVARAMGRRCVGIDGSAEYLAIAAKRTQQLSLLGSADVA